MELHDTFDKFDMGIFALPLNQYTVPVEILVDLPPEP